MTHLSHIISTYEEKFDEKILDKIMPGFELSLLDGDGRNMRVRAKEFLRQFAADITREAFAATKVENKEIPIIWQVVTRGSQAELAKRDRENFNAALALVEARQQEFINEQQ